MKQILLRRGKLFYSILGLLLVFIYVPVLVSLILSQQVMSRSNETMYSILGVAQETEMEYIQEISPGRNHAQQVETLQENTLLQQMGEQTALAGEQIVQAEQALQDVTPVSTYGVIRTYLYFPNSAYLMDSSVPGVNVWPDADPIALSGLDRFYDLEAVVTRVFYYSDDSEDGNNHSVYTAELFPGVLYIFDIAMPDYPNSSREDIALLTRLTAGLTDVTVCDYDSYGNLRLTLGDGGPAGLFEYDSFPDEDGYFSFRAEGKAWLCVYTSSSENMSRCALFCRDEVAQQQYNTTILLWVSGAALAVLCLLVALLFVRRTYRPMKTLMSRLDPGESPGLQDEFAVVNRAIDEYDLRLSEQDRALQGYDLLRLLHGQGAYPFHKAPDPWRTDSGPRWFALAAVPLENGEEEESALERSAELWASWRNLEVRTVSDGSFLYIALRMPEPLDRTSVKQMCVDLQQLLPDPACPVFVSGVCSEPEDLHRGYEEIQNISEWIRSTGQAGVVADLQDLPPEADRMTDRTLDFSLLRRLSDSIIALAPENALQTFDRLCRQWQEADPEALKPDRPAFTLLMSMTALAVYDAGTVTGLNREILQQQEEQLRESTDAEQLRRRLAGCLKRLSKHTQGQEGYQHLFGTIRDYILEHFADPNLDSASIASFYEMSQASLTRLFQRCNGTGFLEFVHMTRVEKAIELLQTTDLSVTEIAGKVGYTNSATMNRAFKTYAGCTPSQIRKREGR